MNTTNLVIKNEQHSLHYAITYNLNPYYEEEKLYEYGIQCTLKDTMENILDIQKVDNISPDFQKVSLFLHTLAKHQVYPIHLVEILEDLLS